MCICVCTQIVIFGGLAFGSEGGRVGCRMHGWEGVLLWVVKRLGGNPPPSGWECGAVVRFECGAEGG